MAKLRVDKIASVGVSTETTGSVFFDGSSDWLRARGGDNFSDFDFGSGDFTIEGFFYANDVNGTDIPIALAADSVGSNSDAGWYIRYQSNKIEGQSFSGSDNIGITTSGTVSNDTWYHVAYVREGSTFTLYVDGTAVDTATSSSSLNWNSGWKVEIGSGYGGANYFAGYISNLRICKGHAVYKSNFVPPTRELEVHQGPDDDRTVLLACYDGENIFAEKTGRHILASQGNRTSSPTLASGETPVGITTFQPGLDRDVDNTFGPTFQGGAGYASQNWLTLPKGTTTDRNRTGGRGLFAIAGAQPASVNAISYIQISSSGNAQDFGDLSYAGNHATGVSSPTRAIFNNGNNPGDSDYSSTNVLDFVTIATTSNSADFGDLTTYRYASAPLSNSTRGVFVGGNNEYTSPYPTGSAPTSYTNTMDYITMAALGNAIDFGDAISSASSHNSATSNSTRGVYTISFNGSSNDNSLYYITIATTGNGQDFGNLSYDNGNRQHRGVVSNGTRGIFGGALVGPAAVNNIDFITIATLGNGQDFGDLSYARRTMGGTSNSVRGVFAGGYDAPPGPLGRTNTIDYINIASTGDAQEFGDLIHRTTELAGASDSHGGLS